MGARLLVLQPSDGDPPERLGEWLAGAGADLVLRRPAALRWHPALPLLGH